MRSLPFASSFGACKSMRVGTTGSRIKRSVRG
jgi:hypothetical protein